MSIETVWTGAAASAAQPARFRLTLLPRPDLPSPDTPAGLRAAARDRRSDGPRRVLLAADAVVALLAALPVAGPAAPLAHPLIRSAIAMTLPAAWIGLLALRGGYRHDLACVPPRRGETSGAGAVLLLGAVTVSYLFGLALPPLLLVASAAVLVGGSALARRCAGEAVRRRRLRGWGLQRVLLVGHPEPVSRVIAALDAVPASGLVAVGAALPFDGTARTPSRGVPVVADPVDLAAVLAMVDDLAADALVLCSDLDISGMSVRHLHETLTRQHRQLLAGEDTQAAAWAPSAQELSGTPLVRLGSPRPCRAGTRRIVLPR